MCPARGEWTEEVFRVSLARVGNGQFREPGGAGATNEGKQKAFVPPPAGRAGRVPREDFEGSSHFPPQVLRQGAGRASRRGTRRPPLGASGALPPRFARLRGQGLPRFCRLHHVGPLRPGTMNILRNTLNSGVFHMNLPSQPLRVQRYLASHPAKGYLVNHHSIRIPSPSGGGVGEADGGGHPSPAYRGGAALRAAEGSPTRAWEIQTLPTKQSPRA